MFHFKDNLFFGRMPNGSVRIIKFTPQAMKEIDSNWPRVWDQFPAHLVEFDSMIDANSWASIIASVSAKGESNGRFYEAVEWHNK